MKRLLAKIGRFFWSWRFLKFALWAVTLIALFYAEEDWRGAHDWAQTKAKWEARGESFDFNRLIPPPVPDSENLAAIPLFKLEPDPRQKGFPDPLALRRALRQDAQDDGPRLPAIGGWNKGELPDFGKISEGIAVEYEKAFGTSATGDSPAELDALYPFLTGLRAEARTRPFCRFATDYTSQPPYARPASLTMLQMNISRILELQGVVALHEKQSDLSLADLTTMTKLARGTEQEPSLLSGLVTTALEDLAEEVVAVGLSLHGWNDAQLAKVQEDLGSLHPLADHQLAMRGELIGFSVPMLDYFKERRPAIGFFFNMTNHPAPFYARDSVYIWWPGGWFDQNKSQNANLLFESLTFVDPRAHRAFPQDGEEAIAQARDSTRSWDAFAPWKIFSSVADGPILNSTIAFAHSQVKLDEASIACALERYRLAHGDYPNSLDELVPAFISEVPDDVMNGEPYHYRLQPDGTFLLYSVGWDQKDDGGVPAAPGDSMDEHGDWVWPVLR